VDLNKGSLSAAQTHNYQEEMPVSVTVQDNICKQNTIRTTTTSNILQNSEHERLNATAL
jgi:precorrin-4 methylase